jgi:plasmid stabilization system protein ParE
VTRPLRLHDDADLELNDTADYYDLKSLGLGGAFLDDLERGFAMIREHPDAAAEVAPGVRRLVLPKFPLSIIYAPLTDVIRVLAIAHQRQKPYYWRGRS